MVQVKPDFGPGEIRSYLKVSGWSPVSGSELAELWRFRDCEDKVVLVPMKPGAPDFAKRTNILLSDVSRLESRDVRTVHDAIATVYHDVTDLRASHPSLSDGSIPLEAGYELFMSAKRLRVASAAASIRRQGHFRNFPLRAKDQAREVRLGQTRRGSYIVPIISQARSPEDVYVPQQEHIDIEIEETLFDRRVTATMSRALGVLEQMASSERRPTGSEIADSVGEGVSYELCRALSKVVNAESVAALDITFNWSRVASPPPGSSNRVEFNRDAIEIVDEVSNRLKSQLYTHEHVLYGVITDLSRRPDEATGRVGIETLIKRRRRTVWFDLADEPYHLAVRCHDTGTPVRAQGVLASPPGGIATMEVSHFGPDRSLGTDA
ncbi:MULTISPECIES: hypothetical protein [Streptomyces]|uniref:hypothetical protein n=1 Tax=Streptomyces TaxID=1883 RepID=UPI00163BEAFD|nr:MULTISPECIES: hypothetical protein [Streptomyces]MBC2873842.1 hypothetical protein [Streptomyces sp. TYQ1024]UBI39211.1 hypothetical protein K7I03_23970 [Streptomyces mobaraensis]UKW31793.1 hypothetical protein MCU78_23915 [Streptomyces sp. TYQ1024]